MWELASMETDTLTHIQNNYTVILVHVQELIMCKEAKYNVTISLIKKMDSYRVL